MNDEKLNINYTKEAFTNPINLGLLLVATIIAFGSSNFFDGEVARGIFTAILGLELMYLGTIPNTPRFRKRMELKKIKELEANPNDKIIFYSLDAAKQRQFLALKHLEKLIRDNFNSLPYSSRGLLNNVENKISALLNNYLKLQDLVGRYEVYLNTTAEKKLKEDIKRNIAEVGVIESEQLKKTRLRRLAIMEKRLKKFRTANEKYQVCVAQLETIEDAIRYFYEQSMTISTPEEIGFQLDNLLIEVDETSLIISELDEELVPDYSTDWEAQLDLDALLSEVSDTDTDNVTTQRNRTKE